MNPSNSSSYLTELKNFVLLHSQAQQLDQCEVQAILETITHAEGEDAGSWCAQWFKAAERESARQNWATATKLYSLARFPYVETEFQQRAHEGAINSFEQSMQQAKVTFETLEIENGAFKAYATGLDKGWPLLVVCGGIVSIKEQWQRFLLLAARIKLCVVVTEMPGVGENNLRYTPQSWAMFPQLIDAVQGRADTRQCHLMALSFSGHLAMHAAARDPRIRGITTVGAPVASFFRQYNTRSVPRVTRQTLSYLTGLSGESLFKQMPDWQITQENLPPLTIPVHYLQSQFDEIIPLSEVNSLKKVARDMRLYQLADVHGSPNYMHLVAPWALSSILSSFPSRRRQAALFRLVWQVKQFWSRRRAVRPKSLAVNHVVAAPVMANESRSE